MDYIEEEDNNISYESESGRESEQNEDTKDESNIGEIQHILTENQNRHLETLDNIVGF